MSPLEQKRARTRKFLNFKNPNTDVANINKTLTKANGKRDKQIDTQTRLQISQNVFKQKQKSPKQKSARDHKNSGTKNRNKSQ